VTVEPGEGAPEPRPESPDVGAIEAALFEHAAVGDCAVLVDDDGLSAVVVLRPGAKIGVDELARHLLDRLDRTQVPDTYRFWRQRLPRGPTGELDRQMLATSWPPRPAGTRR
jgi:acyl-coenzyme A synthetase/AMP-(fatty) acid ligase